MHHWLLNLFFSLGDKLGIMRVYKVIMRTNKNLQDKANLRWTIKLMDRLVSHKN